jgi:hypothetical protein
MSEVDNTVNTKNTLDSPPPTDIIAVDDVLQNFIEGMPYSTYINTQST